MIVVDCSYALAIVMPDEGRPATLERLAEVQVLAPPVWPFEVANSFRSAVRRSRVAESEVMGMCNHLETLGIGIVQPEGHSVRRSYLASMAHGLTAYDASYIELALQRGAALATLDRRLADVARATGLTILS